MTIEEIRNHIGATSLGYLSIPGVVKAVGRPTNEFCLACFNGEYPLAVPENMKRDPFEKPADVVGSMTAVNKSQPELIPFD